MGINVSDYTFTNYTDVLELEVIPLSVTAEKPDILWYADDYTVAFVNESGQVIPFKNGQTIITALSRNSGLTVTCKITVDVKNSVEPKQTDIKSVEIVNKEISIIVGQNYKIIMQIEPNDASVQVMDWSSSDEDVVQVDRNGNITALKDGKAIVTVSTKDGKFSDTAEIIVRNQLSINSDEDISDNSDIKLPLVQAPVVDENGYLINDNLKDFYAKNSDCLAWLYVPGTNMNFPVAYRGDIENSYYLSRGFDKKEKYSGSAFINYLCMSIIKDGTFYDANTTIFGHARGDDIFDQLENVTRTSEWFGLKSNRLIALNTLTELTVWEVFACYYTDSDEHYYLMADFMVDAETAQSRYNALSEDDKIVFGNDNSYKLDILRDKNEFLQFTLGWKTRVETKHEIYGKYMYLRDRDYGVKISSSDKILTLSTCADSGSSIRYVVQAKLVSSKPR